MKKITLILPFVLLQIVAFSQKEWSNWYSGKDELLTFKNGVAERVLNFISVIPPVPPYENITHFGYWGQGGISYSDPVTGDLKFIISQRLGFSKDYSRFPNDTFIRSCPDQKSYHIIPFHNNPDKFYVLQFQSAAADLLAQETGLQVRCPNAIGLAYSIVDLSKNNGLGDITSTNNFITGGLTEQITLVRHANTKDIWIIVHPYGTAEYHAILATDAGFQPPVVSNIVVAVAAGYKSSLGDITASHDGKLLAGCRSITEVTGSESDIELFDFDNASGLLSNYRTMPSEGHVLKLQFSPDNSKLYTLAFDENYENSLITQWDFNQTNVPASRTVVEKFRNSSLWDMQLAPDGKIYLSRNDEYEDNTYHSYLVAIQCPNLPQFACNIKKKAIEVAAAAFPDLVNDFINVPRVPLLPRFSIGEDTAICFGSLTLKAPPGWETYKWNTGDTTRQITINKAGLYFVLTGSTGFSCPSGYGYINVTDKAVKLDLGKDTGLCANTTYNLHVPDDFSNILWDNGSHTRDSVLYGVNYPIYVSANDANGCYSNDTILVYSRYYPRARFGNDTVLCNNEILQLQLEPYSVFTTGGVYTWQDNSTEDHFTVNKPGVYLGKVTYDGCTAADTIQVSYINAENPGLGNDTTVCMGDSLRLTSTIANAKYLWSTNDTTQSIFVKATGEYLLRVTNGSCRLLDTIYVTFNAKPSFSLGNDTALCETNTLNLTPNAGPGSYLWQDGSVQDQLTVSGAGLYWLKLTRDGCSAADSIAITYKSLPPLQLGNDTGICTGTSLRLNAYNAAIQRYQWQDQATQATYDAATTGRYRVTVTGTNGCLNRDSVFVTVLPLPVFTLGNDTAVCDGKTLALNVSVPGASYQWSDGSTSNQYLVKLPGTYWVVVNDKGCSKGDSIRVTYKINPVVQLGRDTTLCEGDIKILSIANPNAVYKWQDGSTSNSYTVIKQGLYVAVADIDGCTSSDSILVSYNAKPVFSLGRDTFICDGQSILLNPVVNGATAYRWQDGSVLSSFNVADTGKYILTVANECGTYTSSVLISRGVCQLFIPSAFSPNMDNVNDVFRVKYPFPVKKFKLAIYNRYGQQVFESNDMARGWDGTFKGARQPMSVFVWVIWLTDIDGRDKTVKGTVTLIR